MISTISNGVTLLSKGAYMKQPKFDVGQIVYVVGDKENRECSIDKMEYDGNNWRYSIFHKSNDSVYFSERSLTKNIPITSYESTN